MRRVWDIARNLLASFGPVIVFVVAEHVLSLRAALAVSLGWTIAEIAWTLWKREKLNRFFLFSAGLALVFGAFDLWFAQTLFLKFEPCATNLITAGYFALTTSGGGSILQELYEKSPDAKVPVSPDLAAYFRLLTWIWTGYFLVKAGFYAWAGWRWSFDEGLAIRTVVGNGSMFALVGLCWLFGDRLFRLAKRLQPPAVSEPSPE